MVAIIYLNSNNYENSLKYSLAAIKKGCNAAYITTGSCYLNMGYTNKALEYFETAKMLGYIATASINMGLAYAQKKDYELMIKCFLEADTPYAMFLLGMYHLGIDDYNIGKKYLIKSLSLNKKINEKINEIIYYLFEIVYNGGKQLYDVNNSDEDIEIKNYMTQLVDRKIDYSDILFQISTIYISLNLLPTAKNFLELSMKEDKLKNEEPNKKKCELFDIIIKYI
jgi:tetratricopeptide (TPR) repeat protein